MILKRIIFLFFAFCAFTVQAQTVKVDWNKEATDSLLPACTAVVDLPADYAAFNYSAHIEYPEYRKMDKAEVLRYKLELEYPSLGEQPLIECFVGIQAKQPQLDIFVQPVVKRNGCYYALESGKIVVDKIISNKPAKVATRNSVERYAQNSVLSQGRWVRISVKENGVHKITFDELKKMGFSNPDKVALFGYGGNILPESKIENLIDDLCEIPLWRENGYVLFYAKGLIKWEYNSGRFMHSQNVYSLDACYFLTELEDAPKVFATETYTDTLLASPEPVTDYPDYALYEKEEKSLCLYGRTLVDKYDYTFGRTKRYEFATNGAVLGNTILEVSFASSAEQISHVSICVDADTVGILSVSARASNDFGKISEGRFSVDNMLGDKTVVSLSHSVADNAVAGYLDFIRLNFVRHLALYGSQTAFRGKNISSGFNKFLIDNSNSNVRVWSVGDLCDIKEVAGELDGDVYSVLAPSSVYDELVAVDVKGKFPSVNVLGEIPNQNLHATGQTDMVIIIPSNGHFQEVAERLADAHRNMDSLSVVIVTAQQVYNEFSSGTPDVTAYRRFMKMLYDRATTAEEAPKYLLLLGDAYSDNRLITTPGRSQDDYLLSFESVNSVNAVRSYVHEDYLGFLDDGEGNSLLRNKVDIGVGRIPVVSVVEAKNVVEKTIRYMNNTEAGVWQNVITVLGDDGDKSIPNQHMKDAEGIAAIVAENYPSYMIDRIYWDDYVAEKVATGNRYPEVTKVIQDRLEKGSFLVNYSGHGGPNQLSHEFSWTSLNVSELTSPRLPFWVMASCDIAQFDLGDNSIGELTLKHPTSGGVGVFTSTRTVLQRYNAILNKAFTKELFSPLLTGETIAVGDAVRRAKCAVIEANSDLSENKLQYVLLGDPALRLKYPKYRLRVTEVNGMAAVDTFQVQAGGHLKVSGVVESLLGDTIKDFTGFVYSNLFDGAELVTTRNNTGLGGFKYTAYKKNIFSGSDSIVNGCFTMSMPIPMDISYSDAMGHLNLFALDTAFQYSAHGHFDNLVFNGTASETLDDGKGPEIRAYLNTPSFVDGDKVNDTPCLWLELYDINGINTIGNSIGHDIVAVVDNDPRYTYNLNSVYQPVVGDFTRGTVVFPIDKLEEGEHSLMVRAWDYYNNSSVVNITFVVEQGVAPEISSIAVSPSPVVSGTEAKFYISHNRPQSTLNVNLEIYNIHGQLLWRNAETGVSDGLVYECSWNGSGQAGQPLGAGVYVARISIATGDASVVKGTKFLVIDNK